MGESTCLMQPFSNPSDTFNLPQEGNSVHVLGESVSFGRFMTESLAWEKWSSFNNNRYLEEVEKCSKPGSVAQKKAYFEAHYKKKRAEQEAAAAAMKDESEGDACLYGAVQSECGDEIELVGSDCCVDVDQLGKCERGVAEVSTSDVSFSFDVKECDSNVETGDLDHIIAEVDSVKEIHVLEENYVPTECVSQHEDVENRMMDKPEIDITIPSEKLPLKETSSANCEPSAIKMKPSASSTKMSVNRAKVHPFTPARPKTPANLRKENNPALSSKKSVKYSADKRKPTPSPLHLSLNFTPSRVGDANKTARPIFSPRFTAGLTKTQKESSSPLPPAKLQESGYKAPKPRPVTPLPDTRIRTKVSVDHTVHVNRKIDVKSLSIDVSRKTKSSTALEKRTWLPSPSASVSSSFSLRSEERAAKRKEYFQKLQEEHNAKEAQKMQLKAKSEEKAEAELRKMRQNLGFKAKPMPDFYHEPQPQKVQLKKIPLTRPRSPKLGRKSSSSGVHETKPLPPRTPSVKNDASNKKPSRTPTASKKSGAHENASPNIQK